MISLILWLVLILWIVVACVKVYNTYKNRGTNTLKNIWPDLVVEAFWLPIDLCGFIYVVSMMVKSFFTSRND